MYVIWHISQVQFDCCRDIIVITPKDCPDFLIDVPTLHYLPRFLLANQQDAGDYSGDAEHCQSNSFSGTSCPSISSRSLWTLSRQGYPKTSGWSFTRTK
jgi:hypothetical protein